VCHHQETSFRRTPAPGKSADSCREQMQQWREIAAYATLLSTELAARRPLIDHARAGTRCYRGSARAIYTARSADSEMVGART
jgi:hypothetical protein